MKIYIWIEDCTVCSSSTDGRGSPNYHLQYSIAHFFHSLAGYEFMLSRDQLLILFNVDSFKAKIVTITFVGGRKRVRGGEIKEGWEREREREGARGINSDNDASPLDIIVVFDSCLTSSLTISLRELDSSSQ